MLPSPDHGPQGLLPRWPQRPESGLTLCSLQVTAPWAGTVAGSGVGGQEGCWQVLWELTRRRQRRRDWAEGVEGKGAARAGL